MSPAAKKMKSDDEQKENDGSLFLLVLESI